MKLHASEPKLHIGLIVESNLTAVDSVDTVHPPLLSLALPLLLLPSPSATGDLFFSHAVNSHYKFVEKGPG